MRNVLTGLVPGAGSHWGEKLLLQYNLKKGPSIVAIGGGTGLSTLLRGLKEVTSNITAIVTVTDDGGSSGRLRGDLGMLPPGDIRNCLVALADRESALERLFNYRFSQGGELAGHSLGNLLLAGLTQETGNLALAVQEVSKILAVRGQVLPVTLDNVVLAGEMHDGRIVKGETNIVSDPGRIKRVYLEPAHCTPLQEAIDAILAADAIILGPGSLYTSVIPNLLVPGITEAIRNSKAKTFYICNIMTQPGETDGYTASRHLKAIIKHCGPGVIDKVIVNNENISPKLKEKYQAQGAKPVKLDENNFRKLGVEVIQYPLCAQHDLARHDPGKTLRVLMEEIQGHTAYLFGYAKRTSGDK
ncbi:MAG TPA: YvcK family protein [Clostridia bacterium]|nr:YvcK family protein [Clostridia bacterium]